MCFPPGGGPAPHCGWRGDFDGDGGDEVVLLRGHGYIFHVTKLLRVLFILQFTCSSSCCCVGTLRGRIGTLTDHGGNDYACRSSGGQP
jgi:hypothetical protein